MEIHPPHGPILSLKEFLIQLVTIAAGILIALSLEGLLEWNHYRILVREARETISREIADNKKDVDDVLANSNTRKTSLDSALRLANELLGEKKSDIQKTELRLNIADFSRASWQTAERTGALGHMEYSEVRRYSELYDLQELFVQQQRRSLDRLAAAVAVIETDPRHAAPGDLETFRQHVRALRGELIIEEQVGRQLAAAYEKTLRNEFGPERDSHRPANTR